MKALQIKGYGEVKSNLVFNVIEKPKINDDEVLIEIFAASTNPIDYKIIEGILKQVVKLSFPTGIGYDLAGVVREKGKNVSHFNIGDAVFASVPQKSRGTFADYVAVDENMICLKPKNSNFEEAASLPMVGLTTIHAFEKANLKAGDKILIHAGSGGIGTFAIQYAKKIGAYVYTTTSTQNVSWVKDMGADCVIDYKKEDYLDIVKDIDVEYDTLGGKYTDDAFKVIKKNGKVVSLIGPVDDDTAKEMNLNIFARGYLYFTRLNINKGIREKSAFYKLISITPDNRKLNIVKDLLESGDVKTIIDKTYPFDKTIEALLYQKTGRAKGKIIVKMK
jgi:NADPH:quinone reductase-like Zn-dependent oxidoreductase